MTHHFSPNVALILLALGAPAFAQSQVKAVPGVNVGISQIAGPNSSVHPLGNRPSLHNGTVAFYGYTGALYAEDEVIVTRNADGTGPFQTLVHEGDPMPGLPGQTFDAFGNPGIYNGRVVFYGLAPNRFSNTYESDNGAPIQLYVAGGIRDPFLGPHGVTYNILTAGAVLIDNNNVFSLLGTNMDPLPCESGTFSRTQVQGLRNSPQSDRYIIWPARGFFTQFINDYFVALYDVQTGTLSCIASPADTIPNLGTPFEYFNRADTSGSLAVFTSYASTGGGPFSQFEGLYLRDVSGTGPITVIADELTPDPIAGNFGTFDNATIDGNLILWEGCSGGQFGCDRYGVYGRFIDNGVLGPIFTVITTDDSLGNLPIIDMTIDPIGRDGNQVAIDIRHAANSASLIVATVTRTPSATSSIQIGSGSNPLCFTSDTPALGQNWTSTIDTSIRPNATLALMLVYAQGSSGTILSQGELLVDLSSSLFLSTQTPAIGPGTSMVIAVPSDPSLAGLSAATQGVVIGGGGFTLCNGYSISLGF